MQYYYIVVYTIVGDDFFKYITIEPLYTEAW